MELCMNACPSLRRPSLKRFGDGELMGKKLLLRCRRGGGGSAAAAARTRSEPARRQCAVHMSIAIGDIGTELKLRDLDMERRDPRTVVAIILGGGAGTRLFPLTKRRAKPAVPIAGAYRLIDVPMSNCINSGINKVYILTQFNSASLNRHLARAYDSNGLNFGDGFVEVLAATQTPGEAGQKWFQGTADAVRQFHWLFEDARNKHIEDVLVLSGDHLYRMDYMDFVQNHRQSGADITISTLPMDDRKASEKLEGIGKTKASKSRSKADLNQDSTSQGISKNKLTGILAEYLSLLSCAIRGDRYYAKIPIQPEHRN